MLPNPLAHPIGVLLRPAETAHLGQSLEVAASKLRESETGVVVVLDEPFLAGVIDEGALASSLARGLDPMEALDSTVRAAATIAPHATGAEALRRFTDEGAATLVVVDEAGRVLGVVTPADLFPKQPYQPRPHAVGGMATPFGVYLTTGTVRAGAGDFALATTGMLLFTLFFAAATLSDLLAQWLFDRPSLAFLAAPVNEALPVLLFLVGMRLLPLAGTHASEHQVVHAIERGERLTPESVRRMPRVHPRCGTNLAVGAGLFLGLFHAGFIPNEQLRLLVAALATLVLWRPLGGLAQWYVTTRPATDGQIEKAVVVGRQLLAEYQVGRIAASNPLLRIWRSGMLHVMAGAAAAGAVVAVLARLLGIDVPI